MPLYTFERPDGTRVRHRLSFKDYESLKSGENALVDTDETLLKLVFDPGDVGVVLKDGPSGGWASKTMTERKARASWREELGRREREHVFKPKLVPNYAGQEANSWSDVKDHVRSTVGLDQAKTYDKLVKKEATK